MRIVKISLWVLGSIIGLILLSAVIVASFYGDQVKNLAIEEINKQIDTKINVKSLDFSLIQDFPNARLAFNDVVVFSASSFNKKEFPSFDTDTLLKAQKVSLQLNIKSLLQHQIKVQRVEITNGKLNLLIDKAGKENYRFWKSNTENREDSLQIDLDKLMLSNVELLFVQQGQELVLHNHLHELELSGKFSDEEFSLSTTAKMWIGNFEVAGTKYVTRRSTRLDVLFDVKDNTYTIRKGSIDFNKLAFKLTGKIISDKKNSIDLHINGNNLDIQSFLSLLPESLVKQTKDIESTGLFYFNTHISGTVSNTTAPNIKADFGIENGVLKNKKADLSIEQIEAKGSFSNGKYQRLSSSSIALNSMKFKVGDKGHFSGKATISNFKNPKIDIYANLDIDLKKVFDLFNQKQIETLAGHVMGNVAAKGTLPEGFAATKENLGKLVLSGDLKLENGYLKLTNNQNSIEIPSGTIALNNTRAKLLGWKINYGTTHFDTDGTLYNPINLLLSKSENLHVSASVRSPKIKIEELSSGSKSNEESAFELPENVNLDIVLKTDSLLYNRFTARTVSMRAKLKNQKLTLSELKLNTLNGQLSGTVNLKESKTKNHHLYGKAQLDDIDIHELLHSFQNFGQDFLTSDHVNGDISGVVNFDSEWTPALNLIDKSLVVESSVEISNGELFDFEPMMALSDFIKVEDLKHIRFSKLKNDIVIQNKQVHIPMMDINSSVIDLYISGVHGFDQNMTYDVKVLLSDILSHKFNRDKKKEWEVEKDPDGLITLFLTIEGKSDDIKVKYNFRDAKAQLRQDIEEEKQEVKTILRDELGLFKNDTTLKKKPEQPKQKPTIIWNEEDEEDQEDPDED